MKRREALKRLAAAGGAMIASPLVGASVAPSAGKGPSLARARVALVRTTDRAAGVRRAIELLGYAPRPSASVFLKPNFNSADAAPGSTHDDVLVALIEALRAGGSGEIVLGDRSGMGDTREVMDAKGTFRLARELGVRAIVFDELDAGDWELFRPEGAHWRRGFALPRPVMRAGGIVQACCLKTHRYGGHFTLSLKNSVGLAAKRLPDDRYDFMRELHGSSHQRRMIAEINTAYRPDLVVMDGVEAFATGGPDRGKKVDAGVVLAASDRVAIDAVGVAILRHVGTTSEVACGRVFEQEQIARAAELGIGVRGPEQIEIVTDDAAGAEYAATIRAVLAA
jgi:uncharacterized protein (DUF362 family)